MIAIAAADAQKEKMEAQIRNDTDSVVYSFYVPVVSGSDRYIVSEGIGMLACRVYHNGTALECLRLENY